MIRPLLYVNGVEYGKPRASGDDPYASSITSTSLSVNPARAGMIP